MSTTAISPELIEAVTGGEWVLTDSLGPSLFPPAAPSDPTHPWVLGRRDPAGIITSSWYWFVDTGEWVPFVGSTSVDTDTDTVDMAVGWEARHFTKHARELAPGAGGLATAFYAVASHPSTSPIPFVVFDDTEAVILTGVMPANTTVAPAGALSLSSPFFPALTGSAYGCKPDDVSLIENTQKDWIWPSAPLDGRGFKIVFSVKVL